MTPEKPPLISVRNVSLKFGAFSALNDVSVDFREGEMVGLVGDNGAGKTTLIRVLCGIHKPTHGSVFFDGKGSRIFIRSSRSNSESKRSSSPSACARTSRWRGTSI